MSLPAFHLSFSVPDLHVAARFYRDVLGCVLLRDETNWLDLSMHGHQLTLHQADALQPARPLDHFGLVMPAFQWQALAHRIEEAGVTFAVPPRVVEPGSPHERGKFVLHDPAGNVLEFKYRVATAG